MDVITRHLKPPPALIEHLSKLRYERVKGTPWDAATPEQMDTYCSTTRGLIRDLVHSNYMLVKVSDAVDIKKRKAPREFTFAVGEDALRATLSPPEI